MKVLIVEDDPNKGEQLHSFIREAYGEDAYLARSLQSGLRRIRQDPPDLVLLDMTLPNYDTGPDEPGGTPHIFGGLQFLRQMKRFKLNVPTIVVTQFETFGDPPNAMGLDKLDAQLKDAHSPTYKGSVYYHASIHGWKDELRKLIDDTVREKGKEA